MATDIALEPLRDGLRMDSDEFKARFDATPGLRRAELLEGVVHMPPALNILGHGFENSNLITWLTLYRTATPGLLMANAASVRVDDRNTPEPDALLMILPDYGGRAKIVDDKVVGGPELVCEVANTTEARDLGPKLALYHRAGIREYLVWRTEDASVEWFTWRTEGYAYLMPDAAGVVRSETFPGLWLDVLALLRDDFGAVNATLQAGIATPEHATFVARLAAAHTPPEDASNSR